MINTPNGKFEIDYDDCYIRNHMMSGYVFEHHIINGILKKYIEKSKYIVDVGANIGCHTVSYAGFNTNGTIWSFEPQKKLYDILSRNVNTNNYSDRVEVFNKGLGHKPMTVQLRKVDEVRDSGHNGWNKAGLGIGKDGETINIVTLDSLELPGLDFMKIDVEGYELEVLKGAQNTLQKIEYLMIELNGNTEKYGSSNKECIDFILAQGFKLLMKVWPDKIFYRIK